MLIPHIEKVLAEAERRAVTQVVFAHPEWTLEQLFVIINGPRGEVLGSLTVHELGTGASLGPLMIPNDGGPPIDRVLLEKAKRARGDEFLSCLREVLAETPGPVGAAYLRARLGGPRWKLQAAVRQLEAADLVVRTGVTCATRYQLNSICVGPRRQVPSSPPSMPTSAVRS